jgi:hypothetical protein
MRVQLMVAEGPSDAGEICKSGPGRSDKENPMNEDYLFVGGRPRRGVKHTHSRSLYREEEHSLAGGGRSQAFKGVGMA